MPIAVRSAARLAACALFLALAFLALCPAMAQKASLQAAQSALGARDFAAARANAAPLADAGDPAAAAIMGYLYEKGLGGAPDIAQALRHYGDAALKGNADAQIALGDLALAGEEVIADYARAAGWYRLAAAQGDARAHVKLGAMFADGVGVPRNEAAAATHYARAAGLGDADGAFLLGLAYINGAGIAPDAKEGARFLKIAAGKGHGEASYQLALVYDSPLLGPPDEALAVRHMAAAAKAGFAPAYAGMGLFAHRGAAPGSAADWFEKGARAGEPQSALLYAVALSRGDGRPRDPAAALRIAERVLSSDTAAPEIRAQAARLKRDLEAKAGPALTLRD